MPKILALSLRPRTLSGLFGQEAMVKAIRAQVAKRPPQSWMLCGGTGTGKTTTARIMSVAYQCQHQELWGDPCRECWQRRADFAIHEINASDTSGVDELARVVELARYKPASADGKRVIILDEAQKISSAAANMLLKPLEEPAASTVWIICTTEPGKILPTLRRRLTTYQLKGLGFSAAEKFLEKQAARSGITRPLADLCEQCHMMGISSPALLLQALEKYAAGVPAAGAVASADGASVESLRICKAVVGGNWAAVAKNLAEATADDARYVRASVAGYIKGVLAREGDSRRQERAAASLAELCTAPYDDAMMINWLWATLHKICRRYHAA